MVPQLDISHHATEELVPTPPQTAAHRESGDPRGWCTLASTEVGARLQLFQMQQQQAADQPARMIDTVRIRNSAARIAERNTAKRIEVKERLEYRIAEREARLEARLLQTPSIATVGQASTFSFKSNKASALLRRQQPVLSLMARGRHRRSAS
jgi:hypothetical protein